MIPAVPGTWTMNELQFATGLDLDEEVPRLLERQALAGRR